MAFPVPVRNSLDFQKNQLVRAVIDLNTTSDPAGPASGQFWYRDDAGVNAAYKRLAFYDGSTVVRVPRLDKDEVVTGNWTFPSSPGVTGSGTIGYLPKWSASSALTNSRLYDDGTSLLTLMGNADQTFGVGTVSAARGHHFYLTAGDANGTNQDGGALRLYAGQSTGNGVSGGIKFGVGATGSSGSSLNGVIQTGEWTEPWLTLYTPMKLSVVDLVGSAEAGAIEYDGNFWFTTQAAQRLGTVLCGFTSAGTMTVGNTNTQSSIVPTTGLGSMGVLAGFPTVAKMARIKARGYFSGNYNHTIAFEVKLGATSLGTTAADGLSYTSSDQNWEFEAMVSYALIDSGGFDQVSCNARWTALTGAASVVEARAITNTVFTNVATNSYKLLDVLVQWNSLGAPDPTDTLTCTHFTLEWLN